MADGLGNRAFFSLNEWHNFLENLEAIVSKLIDDFHWFFDLTFILLKVNT